MANWRPEDCWREKRVPEPVQLICPHLGLETDRQTHLLYADEAHRCFAQGEGQAIDLNHQEEFCLSGRYRFCVRFVEPPELPPVEKASAEAAGELPADMEEVGLEEPPGEFSPWRVALWALAGLLLVLTAIYYGTTIFSPSPSSLASDNNGLAPTLVPTSTPRRTEPAMATPTPLKFLKPTATPTAPPGGANFALSPAAGAVGWVVSSEGRGNHFGDSNIYSGLFGGLIYHGALQFDLSAIPRGAPIYAASLQVTGLNRERLGQGGTWELRILTDTIDYQWPSATYQDIHNATVLQSVAPALGSDDLDVRKVNVFNFDKEQLGLLEERVLKEGKISFRLDGPFSGRNNLFSWDSGYGPASLGLKPALYLSVGPPPATPPPRDYVVVTNTPTPKNVLTAAAIAAKATTEATSIGTATPTPRNLVTATPADWVVVTDTPTPGNPATAQYLADLATAMAVTTGTPTPLPPNVVTATPTPTYVIITSVPTPANAYTAIARAAATATAIQIKGTPTPLPPNWVTPIVVTNTPAPENQATARYQAALATAMALTIGTPTPLPPNAVTATPTPTYVIITSVPTPANAYTAIARAAATATAIQIKGTPTPLPPNWVTPVVVTPTQTPYDPAMATSQVIQATVSALTTGTPTPTPPNLLTATPTPWIAVDAVINPTPTYTPTLTPTPDPYIIPSYLIGRIGFISDRDGGKPWYYVMDTDGSNVQRLTGPEVYSATVVRDTLDPTGQYQVFVNLARDMMQEQPANADPRVGKNYEINLRRLSDGYEWYITGGTKGADYDPAYCQANPRYIVYTSQQTGDDDIFVVDILSIEKPGMPMRTTRLTENTWPWDKHPSWSPDCKQIVFNSNRTGNNQIWMMDFWDMNYAGQNQHNISNNPYNDWDPVWFKPPPISGGPPTPTPLPTPTSQGQASVEGKVVATMSVRVRAGPSFQDTVIGGVAPDQSVQVIGRSADSGWWQIVFPPQTDGRGWVAANYVQVYGDMAGIPLASPNPSTS
jgi:hypothetical protein